MVAGDRTDLRSKARIELSVGSSDTTEFTNDELNRAIDEVTADFSRVMPKESQQEYTFTKQVKDEAFNSAASHGTYVSLANKPIKPKSETVKNNAGTVTYTRDTDYTIRYVTGEITTISTGAMAVSTAFKISYDKSVIAIDISGLTTLIYPEMLEILTSSPPQPNVAFLKWGGNLYIPNDVLTDKDHILLYYWELWTAPTDTARGNFPSWMDEILAKGMVAYALYIKSREAMLLANTNKAKVDTAINGLTTATTGAYDKVKTALDDIRTAGGSPSAHALTKMQTALDELQVVLDKVWKSGTPDTGSLKNAEDVWSASAGDAEKEHIVTTAGRPNAEDHLETGASLINAVNVGQDAAELRRRYAESALAMAQLYADRRKDFLRQAEIHITQAQSYLAESRGWGERITIMISEAQAYIQKGQLYLAESQVWLNRSSNDIEVADRLLADARERHADYWNHLTSRVEEAKRSSMTAVRQYATLKPYERTGKGEPRA